MGNFITISMDRKTQIGFFAIIFSLFSFTTTENCKKEFKGKWKYNSMTKEQMYVKRTLKKQSEYVENGKYYYEFNIKWISNCKYELTYIGTTSPNPAAAKIGESFTVEIIEINDSIMKYKTVFRDIEDIGEMTKIK